MKKIPKRQLPYFALAILGTLCCQGYGATADKENRPTRQEPFAHERQAALAMDAWGGMRVDWTAIADWPTDDSPVAKSVRAWIEAQLQNYRREPFKGNPADWDAMTRFYKKQFLAENGPKQIEDESRSEDGPTASTGATSESRTEESGIKPGTDVFLEDDQRWFCRHSAIIQYEDERIVSYRAGFYGFFVGNVTSAAYVRCATFRKPDGKILGWDAFSDTNAVFELVRELAKVQFKESADIYGIGIPMPGAPLFTKDGFWLVWGDYAIVTPHAYETNNEFPSLFVPWGDPTCGKRLPENRKAVESLLTQEARTDLGIVQPKR